MWNYPSGDGDIDVVHECVLELPFWRELIRQDRRANIPQQASSVGYSRAWKCGDDVFAAFRCRLKNVTSVPISSYMRIVAKVLYSYWFCFETKSAHSGGDYSHLSDGYGRCLARETPVGAVVSTFGFWTPITT